MDFTATDTIDLVSTDGMSEVETINTKLNALVLSTEGTLPGNRNFGLKRNFLSMPPRRAKNIYAIEVSEKAAIYIPEINIKSVSGEITGDGTEDITIQIERKGE